METKKTNGFAIAGFVLSFFVNILGLIFSIIGLNKVKETNSGKGLSIAGIIISSLSIAFGLFVFCVFIFAAPLIVETLEDNFGDVITTAKCKAAYDCEEDEFGTKTCTYYDDIKEIETTITCE